MEMENKNQIPRFKEARTSDSGQKYYHVDVPLEDLAEAGKRGFVLLTEEEKLQLAEAEIAEAELRNANKKKPAELDKAA